MSRSKRYDSFGLVGFGGYNKDAAFQALENPEGFLKLQGRLTRVGVFEYSDLEGNTWGEYRSPQEVFDPASLASFQMVVLTDDHPPEMIDIGNVSTYQVGHVGTDVVREGDYVIATILVTDAATIAAIKAGKVELSCGYWIIAVEEPGVSPDGIPYRKLQTQIRGNHLALVDEGRAGPNCRLILDSKSAFSRPSNKDGRDSLMPGKKDAKIMWEGAEFEVPESFAAAYAAMAEAAKAAAPAEVPAPASDEEMPLEVSPEEMPLEAETSSAEMLVMPMDAEGDPLPEEEVIAEEEVAADGKSIASYVRLLDSAKSILGRVTDTSPSGLKRQMIYKVLPSMRGALDKADAKTLDGAFKVAMAIHKKNVDSKNKFKTASFDAVQKKANEAVSAYDAMIARRSR